MKNILLMLCAVMLSACGTVSKSWIPLGGSRADATVKLGIEYNEMQNIDIVTSGIEIAEARCISWGYTGAEEFGGVITHCAQPGGLSGCAKTIVTKEFACTGQPDK